VHPAARGRREWYPTHPEQASTRPALRDDGAVIAHTIAPAMTLLTLAAAQLAYGDLPLLDRAALTVLDGERIGLIGRNGSGKSSLLRVVAGLTALDDGERKARDGLSVALVEQEPVLPSAPTLRESLAQRGRLEDLHDERERWRAEARLVESLHRFGLDGTLDPAVLSGGERKRGALALALALEPGLLLLDEPTNHLDIDGITRLEELLLKGPTAILITHDRAFLDRVATRIVELDRGALRSYPGNFAAFEARRRDELAAETEANRRFDKFWAQEEVWIRKGVEARRTRNEGRVKRLEALRRERTARRDRLGNIKLTLDAGERSGKLVAELEGVGKRFGAVEIVRDLSLRILRGDRIGLIGPNGAGKSTLIRIVLGDLPPDAGTVRLGTGLQVAYFDQMREQLDPDHSVADTISPGSEWVTIGGERKHVMSYLGDFLFPPRRVQAKVSSLSGGERNRLLLARLFARPANLLVLDEPTNDLDIESLELLESTLQDYAGTLLLVSHDRAFLDNVVTQTLVAEGGGKWREYVGGYSDWLAQRPAPAQVAPAAGPVAREARQPSREPQKAKLTFKEQRDLESLPAEIEALEREQHELTARMAGTDYHKQGVERIKADRQRATEIERLLEAKFERWSALEDKARAAAG
jgi:ATP-binding cassette subfamily F protein uup